MPRAPSIPAKGDVLRWARRTAGFGIREAARHLSIPAMELASIEDGEQAVAGALFQKMIRLYKQVESVLLLPQPPRRDPLPQDFRTAGRAPLSLSPDTVLAIREARRIQRFVSDLRDADREIIPVAAIPEVSPNDDIEKIANEQRRLFGVTVQRQREWRSDDAFNQWRECAQQLGLLVLLKRMPWTDCRGLALWDEQLVPAIVVNSEDRPNARTFTLFHEYAHLMLRQSGVCIQVDRGSSNKEQIERWCNSFAAEFLVPSADLRRVVETHFGELGKSDWTIAHIKRLATMFSVSRYVIGRRLKELSLSNFYDEQSEQLRLYDKRPPRDTAGMKRPSGWKVTAKLSEIGRGAATVILDGVRGRIADAADAADVLGLRIEELRDLDEKSAASRA